MRSPRWRVAAMAGLALAGALYLGRTPSRAVAALVLALGAAIGGRFRPPSEALEARRGRDVVIGAGETVDATLVAAAESVRVDGTIDGDLIVAAARVEVRGRVRGDLVALAPHRGGDRHGGGERLCRRRSLHARRSRRPGALRGGSRRRRSSLARASAGTSRSRAGAWRFAARSGAGATILAHEAEVSGRVARDLRFRGDRLAVQAPARRRGSGPGRRRPGVGRDGRRRGGRDGARPDARRLAGLRMVRRAPRVVLGGHQLLRRGAPRLGRARCSCRDSSSAAPTRCGAGGDLSGGASRPCVGTPVADPDPRRDPRRPPGRPGRSWGSTSWASTPARSWWASRSGGRCSVRAVTRAATRCGRWWSAWRSSRWRPRCRWWAKPIWIAVACLGAGALAGRLARAAGAVRSSGA